MSRRGPQLVAVGGSVARWRSVWRTTPAWVETWKLTSSPLPTTSSVEPPPTSMTSVGVASPAARSLVAPRKVSRASSSPAMTRASSPSPCSRTACEEVLAVGGVAHGAREHGDGPLRSLLVDDPLVLAHGAEHARHSLLAQHPRRVEPITEARDLRAPLALGQLAVRLRRRRPTAACRVRAYVDDRDPHLTAAGGAQSRWLDGVGHRLAVKCRRAVVDRASRP